MKMGKRTIVFLCAAVLFSVCILYFTRGSPVVGWCPSERPILMLDAGHGGEDGGAVAISGTPESQLNLAIALKTDLLCGLYGIPTKMTRSADVSLADESASTLRQKKRSDLMNRVKMVNETENVILISIHQNQYTSSRSKGAQVFFHDDELSHSWAANTQETFRLALEPSNQRKATLIPKTVYLMNHVECPAILVECGFLSNPEENALLEKEEYQTRIAGVLIASYLSFESNISKENT